MRALKTFTVIFIFVFFFGNISTFSQDKDLRKSLDEKYTKRLQGIGSTYLAITQNLPLNTTSLIPNGNFETGSYSSWTTLGDARIISKQGSISAPEGNYMAIITTGSGASNGTTSMIINEKFIYIPYNAKILRCTWNFLSNEYPKWVGSQYNDNFVVNVVFEDSTSQLLLTSLTLNTAEWHASQSGYNGETGWKTSEINITPYRYKAIKIRFQVDDIGDAIVDSALLIDSIEMATEGIEIKPVINSLAPISGIVGDNVTVLGTGFGNQQGYVTFNGIPSPISIWSDTQIKTRVPQGAKSGNVVVRTADGKFSNGSPFTVNDSTLPSVSIISPKENSTVSQTIKIEAAAGSGAGIKNVNFYINGFLRKTVFTYPYSFEWDTNQEGFNGQFKITAEAVDNNAKTVTHSIWVNVENTSASYARVMGKVTNAVSGAAISGASIKVGALPAVTTDSYGKYLYENVPSGDHNLTISKTGYGTLQINISIPKNVSPVYRDFSLYPSSNLGDIIVTAVISKYKGFLHYLCGTDFLVTYTAIVDWGGHSPGKVKFITSNNTHEIATSNTTAYKTFNIALEFKNCATLKVIAISSDGTQSKPKEADFVVISPFAAITPGLLKAIDIGDGYYYNGSFKLNFWDEWDTKVPGVPEDIPIFGGKKEIGLTFFPDVELTSEMDGTTEINLDWSLLSGDKKGKIGKCAIGGISGELGVTLDITGEYLHPQCNYQWGGGFGIYGSFGVEASWPFVVPPGIPMFAKIGGKVEGDVKASVTEINLNPIKANISGQGTINPEIKGTLGGGFDNIFNVAGWLAGGADWLLQWPNTPVTKQFTLYVRAGVSATAWLFKWEQQLLKWDWDLYKSASSLGAVDVTTPPSPVLIPRDYLAKTSPFMSNISVPMKIQGVSNSGFATVLQQTVFPDSQPSLSANQSRLNLVFLQDNPGRSSINRTMAVHSIYENWNWSTPVPIWDNGTADFHPATTSFSDGTVIAAWEDVNAPLPETASLDDMAKNLEISIAIYDPVNKTWGNKQRVTNNLYFNSTPRVSGKAKDNVLLTYIENESNVVLGSSTVPNKIYYSQFNGTSWTGVKPVAIIDKRILKYDLLYNGINAFLVLSTDMDADIKTVNDHELFLLKYQNNAWGGIEQLTNNSIPDDNPQIECDSFGNVILTWVQGNEICSAVNLDISTKTLVTKEIEYSSNLADFKMAASDDGKLCIVWAKPSEYSSDIFLHYYDPTYNMWGNASQISADIETERNIAVAFFEKTKVVAVYNRDVIALQPLEITTLNGEKKTLSFPQVQSTDLLFTNFHAISRDLALVEGSLMSIPANPSPGETVLLKATVQNLGDEAASNISVDFYDGDPAQGGQKLAGITLNEILKSGDQRDVTLDWTLPSNLTNPMDIFAVVDPVSAFDQNNRANNKIHNKLFKPDLLIKLISWQISPNNVYCITARIANDGSTPSGNTSLKFRKNSKAGDLIEKLYVDSLKKGETIDLNIECAAFSRNGSNPVVLCIIDEDNTVDELDETNNVRETPLTLLIPGLPSIGLSKTKLNFGAVSGSMSTGIQTLMIKNTGLGTLYWSAVATPSFIQVAPAQGIGNGLIQVGIDASGLSAGTYTGTVTVSDPNASNSPQSVDVTLKVYGSGATSSPFGYFDTPVDGTGGIEGSLPVTGWALDDIEVTKVDIWRDPVGGEPAHPNGYVYIGDAVFVEGARPDVEQAYPSYPFNSRAGWGYMMLTNFLPNSGSGTFRIHAIAYDKEGHSMKIGTKTITCDNAHAALPFGTIDTPSQGGIVSGNSYVNFGWALTPMPKSIPIDGSTIWLWIDGLPVGHPTYNNYRIDIATLFPGFANSNGAVGYYYIDTTQYANGVHTVAWSVMDSAGISCGIGSRYFTVLNTGAGNSADSGVLAPFSLSLESRDNHISSIAELANIPTDYYSPVYVRKGYDLNSFPEPIFTDAKGVINIEAQEVDRIEIALRESADSESLVSRTRDREKPARIDDHKYVGYLIVGNELRPLPIGSTLDAHNGIFSWQLGPGFVGEYRFVFIKKDGTRSGEKKFVEIKILPKNSF